MARPKSPCGTESAYRRHLREKSEVCEACRDAHAATRRADRRSPAARATVPTVPAEAASADDGSVGVDDPDVDDMELIVKTLRRAFRDVADDDPTKLAPIAREFRAAVEAVRGPVEAPKELTLAEQLAEARNARASRAKSQDTSA